MRFKIEKESPIQIGQYQIKNVKRSPLNGPSYAVSTHLCSLNNRPHRPVVQNVNSVHKKRRQNADLSQFIDHFCRICLWYLWTDCFGFRSFSAIECTSKNRNFIFVATRFISHCSLFCFITRKMPLVVLYFLFVKQITETHYSSVPDAFCFE